MVKKAEVLEREVHDVYGDYFFTEEEKASIAKELAEKNIEIKALEDEKKAVTSNYAAKINQAKAVVNLNATHLNTGKTLKMFKCFLDFDRIKKQRMFRDKETDRVIKTEPMRPEDFQMKFSDPV